MWVMEREQEPLRNDSVFSYAKASYSQPQRWSLPPAHQELLRNALAGGAAGKIITPEQRGVIRQICMAPEKQSFAPEDFLVAFKLALANAANDVGIAPGPERNDFLACLVSVCIEEFYRSAPRSDGAKTADGQELAAGGI